MYKKICLYRSITCLSLSLMFIIPSKGWSKETQRSFLLTVPFLMVAKESVGSFEFNIQNKFGISIDFTSISERSYITASEQKLRPNDQMLLSGQEVSFMVANYTNQASLSGFYWGLGAGYRKAKGSWYMAQANNNFFLLDDDGRSHHYLETEGSTFASRIGYRFVGSQIAGVFGVYLNLRHFNGQVKPVYKKGDTLQSDLAASYRTSLQKRMTTALAPGFEFGWAF